MDIIDMPQCVAIDGLSEEHRAHLQSGFVAVGDDPMTAMLEEEALALWNSTDVQDRFADAEEFCEWYIADAHAA